MSVSTDPLSIGRNAPNTPHDAVNLWSTLESTRAWSLGGRFTAVSHSYADTENTAAVPGYVVFNAMTSYKVTDRFNVPCSTAYVEGMAFGTHVDGTVRGVPGSVLKLRSDLSATLFLSPPQSYDGGELVIESAFGDRTAKLDADDLVVYSSTAPHRVTPVTRGERLACAFWIQSLVRDDGKREQLFELDRTIQGLTQSGADPTALVRLAAHYHGLLRMWTEI